ncbi:MAG TPA: cobalt ECF transporter T component CbiQ [Methanothrix sp.]|nr:cobalt ECF transporter T component CbiQ [Methanothrix sp.]
MIPDWMKETGGANGDPFEAPPVAAGARKSGKKARSSFVKKTIDGVFNFFQEALVAETFSKRDGLLQSLDPRVKLLSILAVVFAVSVTKDLRLLALVYLLSLFFAHKSKIGVGFFIKRVWLFVPFFAGVIVIPVIFNVFLPGDPLYHIADLPPGAHLGPWALPDSIYITKQGASAAVTFTLRVATAVSAVVLLFLSTPQQLLFKSLRSLRVPKVYVLTMAMAYRYIFLFMEMIRDLHIAKKSRTIKSLSLRAEQRWVGGRIGYMLIKSLDMSEKVHMAMVSRGYSGDVRIMHDYHLRGRDYAAAGSALALSLTLILVSLNVLQL